MSYKSEFVEVYNYLSDLCKDPDSFLSIKRSKIALLDMDLKYLDLFMDKLDRSFAPVGSTLISILLDVDYYIPSFTSVDAISSFISSLRYDSFCTIKSLFDFVQHFHFYEIMDKFVDTDLKDVFETLVRFFDTSSVDSLEVKLFNKLRDLTAGNSYCFIGVSSGKLREDAASDGYVWHHFFVPGSSFTDSHVVTLRLTDLCISL